MTKSLNLNFEDKFKIATIALRLGRAHPESVINVKWFLQFFIFMGSFIVCSYFLCYSIFTHHIKAGEFAEASKNGAMVVVAINISYKYYKLIKLQKEIKELMNFVDRDYSEDNQYSDEDKEIVQKYAEEGVVITKFMFLGGFGTFISFPLKGFMFMLYYYCIGDFRYVPMFDIKLPEPLDTYKNNNTIAFWAFFILTLLFDAFTALVYIGFDSLVPILMQHICGQIELLKLRLGKLFVEFDDPEKIEQELKTMNMKMQSLYEFMGRITSYFSILYEVNMKTTVFLLPFSAVLIVQDLSSIQKNPDFVIFFAGTIIHFFVPCYYSDLLMEQCENFRLAIYFSGWQSCPHKGVRQIILFMLTKARISMGIRTIFYELNLDTFAEMCRQAYSIFNMINAAL